MTDSANTWTLTRGFVVSCRLKIVASFFLFDRRRRLCKYVDSKSASLFNIRRVEYRAAANFVFAPKILAILHSIINERDDDFVNAWIL